MKAAFALTTPKTQQRGVSVPTSRAHDCIAQGGQGKPRQLACLWNTVSGLL